MGEALEVCLFDDRDIERHWPALSEELVKVAHLWADKLTLDYFYHAVFAKHMQVWGVGRNGRVEMTALTQVVTYPANRFFQIVFILGEGILDEGLVLLEERWHVYAAMQGCRFWESPHARAGWERKLGGRKTGIVLGGSVRGMVN